MHARNAINAFLFAAALGLGALTLLGTPKDDDSIRARLTGLTPSNIRTLEIEYPPDTNDAGSAVKTLALERRPDGWHIIRPIERRARDGRLMTALKHVNALSDACYSLNEHDPAEFGLAEPRLRLRADDTELAFGDRANDGRRYVRAQSRMCLIEDRTVPLLAQGLDGLADPALLADGSEPLRIATPSASAERVDATSDWSGTSLDAVSVHHLNDWAARWLAAQAKGFVLAPSQADHGRIRIETADGQGHQWRIAQMPPQLVLVPRGADYGIRVAAERADALMRPTISADPSAAGAAALGERDESARQ